MRPSSANEHASFFFHFDDIFLKSQHSNPIEKIVKKNALAD